MPVFETIRPPLNAAIFQKMHGLLIISDGSWKTDHTYFGFFVLMGGAAVDWASHLAKVKLSSTEPEIGAGSYAGKRSAYLRGFIGEIIQLPRVPIQHIVDNSATPALTENNGVSKKSRHFRRWMHYLRYLVTHGFTYVHLCRTHEMWADAMTKVSDKNIFFPMRRIFYGYV